MIYPADFEQIVGFDRVKQSLADACRYETSTHEALNLELLTDKAAIMQVFDLMDEWQLFTSRHANVFQPEGTKDISAWLPGLQVENFYFAEDELLVILRVIQVYSLLLKTLSKQREDYPLLIQTVGESAGLNEAESAILSAIDLAGELRPNASVELGKLNNAIGKLEQESRQLTRSLFKAWREAGYTADTDLTVREERLVIPVKAEFKRKVRGFVKDVSATGQVLYIEPVESLELNNRLKELYADKRREREKILIAVASKLRPLADLLEMAMQGLNRIDLVAARLSVAGQMEAIRPEIADKPEIEIRNGYHPVLKKRLGREKKPMVPLNLKLDETERMMIISGPNAGGKSVTLKTAMLLQYMVQHGLFAPAAADSRFGVFRHFLVDCGDGQSLDDGLSTFSAHLVHLKTMADMASRDAFMGIDEIGDGTDPRFGGPIAQSILEELLEKGAFAIVTTHFSRLKEWAGHTDGAFNASMAYDTVKLQPLYKLVSGRPGSSFALELLKKTGFDDNLLERVKVLSGEESGKAETLLVELEQRQHELNMKMDENSRKQAHLDHLLLEYQKLKEKVETRRNDIVEQAKDKARRLLEEANKQIEMTIRVIQENKADKVKTGQARANLHKFKEKVEKTVTEVKPAEPAIKKPQVQVKWLPGMLVKNVGSDTVGEVLEVKKDKLKVVFGLVQVWMPVAELEPATEVKKGEKRKSGGGFNWVDRNAAFSPHLDVRGQSAEDAMNKVRNWLDEAYALGQFHLKLIHGRGDGILRKVLREYFKTLPYMRSYRSEREEHGGDGCTVIELM